MKTSKVSAHDKKRKIMKRLLLASLLTTLLLPAFCSCSRQSAGGSVSEPPEQIVPSRSIARINGNGLSELKYKMPSERYIPNISDYYNSNDILDYEVNSQIWRETDKSDSRTFSKDCDGILLTVTTDKSDYTADEPIRIRACLKNNTESDICLFYGEYPIRYPISFGTEAPSLNEKYLLEKGDGLICTECAEARLLVAPGAELDDYITYTTYSAWSYGGKALAEEGVYNGCFSIGIDPDPNVYDNEVVYKIDFTVKLI